MTWNSAKVDVFRESFYDFTRHILISSKDGRLILGDNLYQAQHIFFDAVFDGLRDDCHEFYLLKSRQLGVSTGTRALTLFWLGMHEGMRGAMVFDTAFNTAAARREIVETVANLPKSLKFPGIKSNNRDSITLDNDSQLMFMQAGTRNSRAGGGLGRSLGLNLAHCSEVSSWVNDEGVTSFKQSLSETAENRLYIWESTGRGFNVWYKLWEDAKKDQLTKRTIFLGWWSKETQRLERTDARFALYSEEPPNKRENERMNAVAEVYGCSITPEQLAWIRWKTDPGREFDEDDPEDTVQAQEQAWVELDSFQQTGSSFFVSDKLSQATARLADVEKPKTFKFYPGIDFVTCDMQPARTYREVEFRMWEEPVQGSWYVVAADPAFGHNENNANSAAQVLRCYADGVDQVGEFASASIHPHQFAWLLWTLIGYYGAGSDSQVMMICELNGPGEEVWRQFQSTRTIVQSGYLRPAAQKKGIADIFNNARSYIYTRSDSMGAGSVYMWKTNLQNKIQIMEAERNYFHNGVFIVNSYELLEEMRTITRDGDTIGAENDNRDDRNFSAALGIRAWEEKIRRQLVAGNRTKEAERARFSGSIEDQWAIHNRYRFETFFKDKGRLRMLGQRAATHAAWRSSVGSRRPQTTRRW